MENLKKTRITLERGTQKVSIELPYDTGVDELLESFVSIARSVVCSEELIHESIENYYETFIKKEIDDKTN